MGFRNSFIKLKAMPGNKFSPLINENHSFVKSVAEFTNESAQAAVFSLSLPACYCMSGKYSQEQEKIRESGTFDQRLKWNDVNLPKSMI